MTPPAAASAVQTACTTVGTSVTAALAQGGEQAQAALEAAASQCTTTVQSVPAGDAQEALQALCDAIGSASEG